VLGFLLGCRLPLHIVPFVTQYIIHFRGNPSPQIWYQNLRFFSVALTPKVVAPLLAAALPDHRLPSSCHPLGLPPPCGHHPPGPLPPF
jgi:hypothetical protein